MKKLILLTLLIMVMAANKIDAQETKVLFNVPKIKNIGYYFAPEYQYGQISNEYTSFRVIAAMVLLNNRLGMGIATQTVSTQTFVPASINSNPLISTIYSLQSRFTGLKFEYILMPTKLIHITFPLLIGTSTAAAVPSGGGGKGRGPMPNNYFVVQPGVQVELNLINYIKLYTGINYRLSKGNNIINLDLPGNTLQGLSFNIGTKIGVFDRAVKRGK